MSDSENDNEVPVKDENAVKDRENKKRGASEDNPAAASKDSNGKFADETLACRDCEADFTFTVEEQEFFEEKGYTNKPVRCKECRNAKKQRGSDGGGRGGGGRSFGGGDRACYNCGGSGHMSRDCTEPRKAGGRGGGGGGDRACYNCGQSGHMSYECTEARQEGGGGRGRGGGRGGGRGRGGGGRGRY